VASRWPGSQRGALSSHIALDVGEDARNSVRRGSTQGGLEVAVVTPAEARQPHCLPAAAHERPIFFTPQREDLHVEYAVPSQPMRCNEPSTRSLPASNCVARTSPPSPAEAREVHGRSIVAAIDDRWIGDREFRKALRIETEDVSMAAGPQANDAQGISAFDSAGRSRDLPRDLCGSGQLTCVDVHQRGHCGDIVVLGTVPGSVLEPAPASTRLPRSTLLPASASE